jgi:hypothetical protein
MKVISKAVLVLMAIVMFPVIASAEVWDLKIINYGGGLEHHKWIKETGTPPGPVYYAAECQEYGTYDITMYYTVADKFFAEGTNYSWHKNQCVWDGVFIDKTHAKGTYYCEAMVNVKGIPTWTATISDGVKHK